MPKFKTNSKVLLKNDPMKKIHVSNTLLKFSWFLKFCQFLRFKVTIWINRHEYSHFFVIIVENGVLYILIEWLDNISRKCQKWTICAHGLNCIILINSELIFEIYDENYPKKKISCLSDDFEIFVTQPGRSLVLKLTPDIACSVQSAFSFALVAVP